MKKSDSSLRNIPINKVLGLFLISSLFMYVFVYASWIKLMFVNYLWFFGLSKLLDEVIDSLNKCSTIRLHICGVCHVKLLKHLIR